MTSKWSAPGWVAAAGLLVSCDAASVPTEIPEGGPPPAYAIFGGEWAEPVLIDAAVNSPFAELGPELSPDKLSLYFSSDRPPDAFADAGVWVSRRACLDCPWQPAQRLPSPINVGDHAGTPTLSHDGHLLFWSSNRKGSELLPDGSGPSQDIWMATRKNPKDDFGWENPVRLVSPPGCEGAGRINTEGVDALGSYVVAAAGAPAHLYFGGLGGNSRVAIGRNGEVLGCAKSLTELGTPAGSMSVRADGLELIFWAPPARGGLGGADLWGSTRRNVTEPWSTPVNLGAPVNSPVADLEGSLSHDGTTLVFAGGQARGGLGLNDIWITTRARGR